MSLLPLRLLFLLLLWFFSPPASKRSSSSLVVAEQVGVEQLSILGQPPPVQRWSLPANPKLASSGRGKAILSKGGDVCVAARRPGGAAGERNQIQLASLPFMLFIWPRSVGLLHHARAPVCWLVRQAWLPGVLFQVMQRPR